MSADDKRPQGGGSDAARLRAILREHFRYLFDEYGFTVAGPWGSISLTGFLVESPSARVWVGTDPDGQFLVQVGPKWTEVASKDDEKLAAEFTINYRNPDGLFRFWEPDTVSWDLEGDASRIAPMLRKYRGGDLLRGDFSQWAEMKADVPRQRAAMRDG